MHRLVTFKAIRTGGPYRCATPPAVRLWRRKSLHRRTGRATLPSRFPQPTLFPARTLPSRFPQPTLFPARSAYGHGRYAFAPNHPAPPARARSSLQRGGRAAAGQGAEFGGRCAGSAPDSELGAAWAGGGGRGEAAGGSRGGAAAALRPRRSAAAARHGWPRRVEVCLLPSPSSRASVGPPESPGRRSQREGVPPCTWVRIPLLQPAVLARSVARRRLGWPETRRRHRWGRTRAGGGSRGGAAAAPRLLPSPPAVSSPLLRVTCPAAPAAVLHYAGRRFLGFSAAPWGHRARPRCLPLRPHQWRGKGNRRHHAGLHARRGGSWRRRSRAWAAGQPRDGAMRKRTAGWSRCAMVGVGRWGENGEGRRGRWVIIEYDKWVPQWVVGMEYEI
jgi:hypothetical protein